MYPNWLVLLHLPLVCLGVASQMFAQPLTKNHSSGILSIKRAEGQQIEEAALPQHLQQITGSEALAPLLLELLDQTVPNWQQQQKQQSHQQLQPKQQQQQATNQPQQRGQHFFVYENAAGQPPQILAGFNGVNVQPEQHRHSLQPKPTPKPSPKPFQTEQQNVGAGPKIVKAPPAAAVWAPELKGQHHPLPSAPSPATAAPASCQLCCNPSEVATPPTTPCPPPLGSVHETIPLLSATALKATAG
ncbi:putative cyclin-dependent serine/threonine-protein kinase DDB_G0272797/DDB_G0274007 [Drosophila takahashii]|uniref:putative cyclin-dependent serine/threonine-protein kinase DDB_G0272797/DDB_G0274007 n=1 Tax=Drosophila takahashii TaxID=29030 RepID=UPI001CF81CA5|nr:putative cyclin-dependent serine/threonine-protein kinase DDB_G0272797/DDB_G0274007 [Drosophila takahashii]